MNIKWKGDKKVLPAKSGNASDTTEDDRSTEDDGLKPIKLITYLPPPGGKCISKAVEYTYIPLPIHRWDLRK